MLFEAKYREPIASGAVDVTFRRWKRSQAVVGHRYPGVRAPDLAASFGRETAPFKLDVRKLKALGLTISLQIGYRLSRRGESYLSHRH